MKFQKYAAGWATAMAVAALVGTAQAQLQGQLGILSEATLAGNNPATGVPWQAGDTYRLVFVTSTTRNAESADVADYNTFVQGVANASTLNLSSVTWKAIASTLTVDARDNTSTNPDGGDGEATFLMDGSTVVGETYDRLWSWPPTFGSAHSVNLNENGLDANNQDVWSGTLGSASPDGLGGEKHPTRYLGTLVDPDGKVTYGRTNVAGGGWVQVEYQPKANLKPFYGISEPLTIMEGAAADPQITAITSAGVNLWDLTLKGAANTGYEFYSDATLTFDPGTILTLTAGSTGTVSGNVLTTDLDGNGEVQVTLSGTKNFVRAQTTTP